MNIAVLILETDAGIELEYLLSCPPSPLAYKRLKEEPNSQEYELPNLKCNPSLCTDEKLHKSQRGKK